MQNDCGAAAYGAIRLANRAEVEALVVRAVISGATGSEKTGPRHNRRETGAQIRFETA